MTRRKTKPNGAEERKPETRVSPTSRRIIEEFMTERRRVMERLAEM